MVSEVSASLEIVSDEIFSFTAIENFLNKSSQIVSQIAKKAIEAIGNIFQSILVPLQSTFASSRHSFLERIFRTSYFRLAALSDGWIERAANRVFLCFSKSLCNPPVFDNDRAERSLNLFKALGAIDAFVTPKDGNASIHMMTLKAKDFEKVLQSHGARWERKTLKNEDGSCYEAFVITCTSTSAQWLSFKKEVLSKFGWDEREVMNERGESFSAIITSENADLISDSACFSKLFFFTHSPSTSFIHERERAAYYIGMKQDVCLYDSRGIWKSKGSPSEAGFYLDVERVFEELLT